MLSRRRKSKDGKQEDRDEKRQRRREAEKQNKKRNQKKGRRKDVGMRHYKIVAKNKIGRELDV